MGPDGFGNIILKYCCKTVCKSLTLMFRTIVNKENTPKFGKLVRYLQFLKKAKN